MDRWETPPNVFKAIQFYIKKKFNDNFTLDPASSHQNHLCEKYYTYIENGLLQDWAGEYVFVNPPYSDIENWVMKCYSEGQKRDTLVALLIPARTDTIYWHKYCMKAERILFCKGRINFFLDGIKPKKGGATFPSIIAIFKKTVSRHPAVYSFDYKKEIGGTTLKKFI